jgi:hypothetical protein
MSLSNFGHLQSELASHGVDLALTRLSFEDVADTVRELDVPPRMLELYLEGGPEAGSSIPWVTEELQLFSIKELVAAQQGYRWTGPARTRDDSWPAGWIVVASAFGDPFIVDANESACPVFHSMHGAAAWRLQGIAPSVDAFIDSLTAFESVLLGEFQRDIWDDDGLLPSFSQSLGTKLAAFLPNDDIANFLSILE